MPNYKTDRRQSAQWAYDLLQHDDWCILDTETTGLDAKDQICQIALIDSKGETLLDTLVRPTRVISPDAMEIHGIANEQVATERFFPEVFVELWRLTQKRQMVIYNAGFDTRLICQSLAAWGLFLAVNGRDRVVAGGGWEPATKPPITLWSYDWINGKPIHCAMHWYSQWCGDWSDYHGNYRWQRLPGGDHTALGDCKATLEVIKRMAASYEPEPPVEEPPKPQRVRLVEMPQIETPEQFEDIPF